MSSIASCPKCSRQVTLPFGADPNSIVQCPLCNAQYSLGDALNNLPPLLMLVGTGMTVTPSTYAVREPGEAGDEDMALDLDQYQAPAQSAAAASPEPDKWQSGGEDDLGLDDLGLVTPDAAAPAGESLAAGAPLEFGSHEDDGLEAGSAERSPEMAESAEHAQFERFEMAEEGVEFPAAEAGPGDFPSGDDAYSDGAHNIATAETLFDESSLDLPPSAGDAQEFADMQPLAEGEEIDLSAYEDTEEGDGAAKEWSEEGEALAFDDADHEPLAMSDDEEIGFEAPAALGEESSFGESESGEISEVPAKAPAAVSLRNPPRPKRRKPSMVANIVGIAGGGVIGLGIGYMVLLWVGGPGKDVLGFGKKIAATPWTSWLVPASFAQANQPATKASGDVKTVAQAPGAAPQRDVNQPLPSKFTDFSPSTPGAGEPAVKPAAGKLEVDGAEPAETKIPSLDDPSLLSDDPAMAIGPKQTTATKPVVEDNGFDPPAKPATKPADMPAEDDPFAAKPAKPAAPAEDDPFAPKPAKPTPAEPEDDPFAPKPAKPTTPTPDSPTPEPEKVPPAPVAAKPALKEPKSYSLDEVDQALADAKDARAAFADALKSDDKDKLKPARGQFYRKFYRLAEVLTFAKDDADLPARRDEARSILEEVSTDADRVVEMGRAAGKWLGLASRGPDQGALLSGTVKEVVERGRYFETKLTLPSEEVVSVLSDKEPELEANDQVIVIGGIIDDPANKLNEFDGDQPNVIWNGMVVKVAAAEK